MSDLTFPDGFVWGAATSAYQIEGAVREDGRGESIWDRFCRAPGAIANGDSGEIACDHYHRWQQDIELMREMGLVAYRFSVSWPRVLPRGYGRVNSAGLDFYERLVDALLAAGVEPWLTLYHFDLPARLEDRGGWASRDTAKAFAEFADAVVERLGDRVTRWITINEPWTASMLGYAQGIHAPGRRDWAAAIAAAHHLLLAHGLAAPVIRGHSSGASVGIELNPTMVYPASDREEDSEAALRVDGLRNRWWLDALSCRSYPGDVLDLLSDDIPEIEAQDMEQIATPIDFLGIDYFNPQYVSHDETMPPLRACDVDQPELEHTATGWVVDPGSLTGLLGRLHREYAFKSLVVAGNGAAFDDPLPQDGTLADPRRVGFLHDHLEAILEARTAGVPVDGYFVWSLMDNFEWTAGYTKRFGLVHVDFETQQRTIKESGRWFSRVIEGNALVEPIWD